jgi:branched-chain amino acid transport system permease protein
VDDRNLAQLNGSRPGRASMTAWAMSSSLAGLAGILLAAEVGLNIVPLTLLVVSAYAAAIVGRLRSLPWTFAGALMLGTIEAYTLWANGTSWWPAEIGPFSTSGFRSAVPTIFLFVVLIALPQARLRAGTVRIRQRASTPQWSTSILGAGLLVVFVVAISGLLTRPDTILLSNGLILAIAGLSLVPLTGYAGQLSLAPLTFAGLGAVLMGKLPWGGSPLTLVVTVLIVAAVGALVALPALRLQGIYLALATAAFAIMVSTLLFAQTSVFTDGVVNVPPLDIPGFDLSQPSQKLVFLSMVFAGLGLGVVALRRSLLGRRMVAMKDSPLAGATLGMNLTRTKLAAFTISAAIAAFAGALDAGKVTPDLYTFERSLPLVLLVVVGGVGAVSGALFGGMLLTGNLLLAKLVPSLKNVTRVLPGIIGITLGRNPDGAVPQIEQAFAPVSRRWTTLITAIGGGVVLRLAVEAGLLDNWSFAMALVVWVLAVVPNLPALLGHPPDAPAAVPARRALVGAVLLGAVALAAILGLDSVGGPVDDALRNLSRRTIDSGFVQVPLEILQSGWRLFVVIALVAVAGVWARRALNTLPDTVGDDMPGDRSTSPDPSAASLAGTGGTP